MNFENIIGITGGAIVLVAFLLENSKKITNETLAYDFLNSVGSALLVWYALLLGSIPFAIINIVWGVVSLIDVFKYLHLKYSFPK